MRLLQRITGLIAVASIYLNVQASEAKLYTKEWTVKTSENLIDRSKHSPFIATLDNTFMDGFCDTSEGYEDKIICTVVIEKPIFENVNYKETCNFHLDRNESILLWSVPANSYKKYFIFSEVSTGDIASKNKNYVQIRSLNMNNCNVTVIPTKIKYAAREIIDYVWYSNSFEIYYNNGSVDHKNIYRVTYDLEGNKINGQSAFLPDETFGGLIRFRPVDYSSPSKGLFVYSTYKNANTSSAEDNHSYRTPEYDYYHYYIKVMYVDATGAKRYLLNSEHTFDETVSKRWTSASTEHNMFGLCWMFEFRPSIVSNNTMTLHCVQFDINFNVIMNTTSSLVRGIQPLKIYNLPEGGFLLLTVECEDNLCTNMNIWRVEVDGRRIRSYEITKFEFDWEHDDFVMEIFENKKSEFCFYFYERFKTNRKFTNVCLPKEYIIL